MRTVDGQEMRRSLQKQLRVYLCGKLSASQDFESVETDGLEFGISYYEVFTAEKAHFHKWNCEYNFVIQGSVKVYNISEQKEYEFHKDDMYVIDPDMIYITKARPGTEVIFVKSPGGNDKQLVKPTAAIEAWSRNWEAQMNNGDKTNESE